MVSLADLWLPILLSAVFVFVASSIIHMALPIHKGDYGKLPGEDKVLEALRAQNVQPGSYMFPAANSMKECGSPEMVEKLKRGPVGNMNVIPNGPMNMGKSLVQWFVFCLVVSVITAHVASAAARGQDFRYVFHFTAITSFLAYGFTDVTNSIWKGVRWSITAKFLFDGLIYAVVTGSTFGWLWPGLS
jgi:hypothetical protein